MRKSGRRLGVDQSIDLGALIITTAILSVALVPVSRYAPWVLFNFYFRVVVGRFRRGVEHVQRGSRGRGYDLVYLREHGGCFIIGDPHLKQPRLGGRRYPDYGG